MPRPRKIPRNLHFTDWVSGSSEELDNDSSMCPASSYTSWSTTSVASSTIPDLHSSAPVLEDIEEQQQEVGEENVLNSEEQDQQQQQEDENYDKHKKDQDLLRIQYVDHGAADQGSQEARVRQRIRERLNRLRALRLAQPEHDHAAISEGNVNIP